MPRRDPSLPHQIIMYFVRGQVAMSCNCLCVRPGCCTEAIAARKVFPADEAIAAWRDWHAARSIPL